MPTFSEEIDFVITTYDFLDDCDNHEFIIQHGYIPFEPLYSTNHKSYLKIIQ